MDGEDKHDESGEKLLYGLIFHVIYGRANVWGLREEDGKVREEK
jgi:hypothetical protein